METKKSKYSFIKSVNTEIQTPINTLIHKASYTEKQKNVDTEKDSEPNVNLTIKVPLALRRHWASEAKRQGVTVTEVITEALKARFGERS